MTRPSFANVSFPNTHFLELSKNVRFYDSFRHIMKRQHFQSKSTGVGSLSITKHANTYDISVTVEYTWNGECTELKLPQCHWTFHCPMYWNCHRLRPFEAVLLISGNWLSVLNTSCRQEFETAERDTKCGRLIHDTRVFST